jgi:MFS transporter, MHS family, proline/betaine transporter
MKKSKLIFTAGLGTLFEAFDFYLFSLFAFSLNESFFGKENQNSVLWIFIVFSIGYIARIVGALFFGYWGDKLGRLYSFKRTITLIALSSIAIGVLPTYNSIGVFAIICLIILRFIQGVSFGGEISGAIIIIKESLIKYKVLSCMCLSIMASFGIFLAILLYQVLHYLLGHELFIDYGWRVAYIFGGIILFHSYQARKKIAESDEFILFKNKQSYKNTIYEMLINYKRLLILGVLSIAGIQLYWGAFFLYFPQVIKLNTFMHEYYETMNYTLTFGLLFGYLIGGIIAQFSSIRVTYTLGSLTFILLIYPTYFLITKATLNNIDELYFIIFVFSLIQGVCGVLCLLMLANRYPISQRYTLVAVSFALSALIFIGIPPFIFSYFTRETTMYIPMIVLGIGYIVQLIAVQIFYKKTKNIGEK